MYIIVQNLLYSIPPDQRYNVYCTNVMGDNALSDWNFLLSQYQSIVDLPNREHEYECDRLLYAMACPSNQLILQQLSTHWSIPSQSNIHSVVFDISQAAFQ